MSSGILFQWIHSETCRWLWAKFFSQLHHSTFSLYKTPQLIGNSNSPLFLLLFSLSLSLRFEKTMDSSVAARRPYFIDEDDGLVSLVDVEAGISGNQNSHYPQPFFHRPRICHGGTHRRGTRNLSVSSSRVSARFYDARFEHHHHHFLEACFLCKKPLSDNKDIFMYRLVFPLYLFFFHFKNSCIY